MEGWFLITTSVDKNPILAFGSVSQDGRCFNLYTPYILHYNNNLEQYRCLKCSVGHISLCGEITLKDANFGTVVSIVIGAYKYAKRQIYNFSDKVNRNYFISFLGTINDFYNGKEIQNTPVF